MRSLCLLYSKKGQFGSLQGIITTLIVIGILLGIAFLVLEEFKGTMDDEIGAVEREMILSVGPLNTAPGRISSNIYNSNCFSSFAVKNSTSVRNATSNTIISPTNYSYSSNGSIWFTALNNVNGFNNSNWNVSYTYKYGKEGCGGVESTIDATTTITTWLSIIVILAIVGILLAIVFSVLPSSGGGSSGGSFRGFGKGSSSSTAEI